MSQDTKAKLISYLHTFPNYSSWSSRNSEVTLREMSNDLKRHLGSVVRVARQRAKLTQEALAAQIARTPESVSNIERGVQLPTIETLADLGRVLGLPIAEFFVGLPDGQRPSLERTRLEAKLRETARELDDRDLAIAVDQITAFLAYCSSGSGKAPSAKAR